MEAREARHAREAVVRHLARGVVLAQRGPQGPALHLHLRRGGDTSGGVRVDGAPRHAHPPHHGSPRPHPAHAAHAPHPAHAAHPPGHRCSKQRLPLPPLGGGSLEDVLGRELVLRVHPHLVHVGQQTVLVSEDRGADAAGPHPEGGGQLAGHLRVTGQVLPQAALVNIELPAHWTRVVRTSSLCWEISR